MDIIQGLEHLGKPSPFPVLALGNFDGLHRGHQYLVQRVIDRAKEQGGSSIVLTFEPHPLKVLAPTVDLKLLTDFDEKAWLLREMGVDTVLCVRFTQAFAALSPDEFVKQLLVERIHLKEVLVGEDFSFGRDRAGKVKDLKEMGAQLGFSVQSIKTVKVGGKVASSSRIRKCLLSGKVEEAAGLLGRIYSLEGKVASGARRGTKLGFPTANLKPPKERVIPENGIYAAWGEVGGQLEPGVAYIGTQPTLGQQDRTIEIHFFRSMPDLYGATLRIGFQQMIRREEVFKDQETLIKKIEEDIRLSKKRLVKKPIGKMLRITDHDQILR